METLNNSLKEYTAQLSKGHIQKAYKGIMNFMSDLRADFVRKYPDYNASSLYFGYMDMTYFAFTPSVLKKMKLKIAIVFLHEECKFEAWLAGDNRKIQSEYVALLGHKNIGRYTLSKICPGVDSIIESLIVEKPDFDNPAELKKKIEISIVKFAEDIQSIISDICNKK